MRDYEESRPGTVPGGCGGDGVFSVQRQRARRLSAVQGEGAEVAEADRVVQEVLSGVTGSVVFLRPVFGPTGEVADLRFVAVTPGAVDIGGRRGDELVGLGVLETYPGAAGTDVWHGYLHALKTGERYEGELEYEEIAVGVPHRSRYGVRAVPCQDGLIVSWLRLDTGDREQRRLALMQRLAKMGWADWDLVRNVVTWSDEVYTIFDRAPSRGPMPLEQMPTHVPAEDQPALGAAVQRLVGDGTPIDHTFRITTANRATRHIRIVAEAETDGHGVPLYIHGFFQDLTDAKHTEHQLLEQQRTVLAHQSQLAAERDLAARLQDTLLPVPQRVLRLAGLTVDVAYRPLQEGLNLGGDWYSAIELPDGSAFLVVGDVAGHGLDAVATMALLRFTAKGMAITGTPLPTILKRLNTLVLHNTERPTATATMIMAVYQPSTAQLTWVQAGHLPPLLLRKGESRFLPNPDGILLGATDGPQYEASTLELMPGDHLLLCTDGLIERVGEPIDESLVRLARTALDHTGSPAFLDHLLSALVDPDNRRDDICAVHVTC